MAGRAHNRKSRAHDRKLEAPVRLTGWKAIAGFLSQPVSAAQRWAKSGMPVERKGRFVTAEPDELSRWLGRESGTDQAVHIPALNENLSAELERGLAEARRRRRIHRIK